MISHKFKCAMIHIPRTGGSSIEEAFNEPLYRHYHYEDLLHCINFDKYHVFSVVRHPYSRIISIYNYLKIKHSNIFDLPSNLRDFIIILPDLIEKENENVKFWLYPQSSWIVRDNKIVVDRILYYEKLNEDFNKMCLDLNICLNLPHINQTHAKEILDLKSRDIVKSIYKSYWKYFN